MFIISPQVFAEQTPAQLSWLDVRFAPDLFQQHHQDSGSERRNLPKCSNLLSKILNWYRTSRSLPEAPKENEFLEYVYYLPVKLL